MRKQKYPPGWNEQHVREVAAHYDNQTEEERIAEFEAAWKEKGTTMMVVPNELVPKVRALLARKRSA